MLSSRKVMSDTARREIVWFAVFATLVMFLTAFNANFLGAVFAARGTAAGPMGPLNPSMPGSNATIPPPAPAAIPVSNGTVSSVNRSPNPEPNPSPPVTIAGSSASGLVVTTGYGEFVVHANTSYWVSLYLNGEWVGNYTFAVVMRNGVVLSPSAPSLARTPDGFVSTYALSVGARVIGTMRATYAFTRSSDTVTAAFVLAGGASAQAAAFSILWIEFTGLDYVTTSSLADVQTPFSAIARDGWQDLPAQRGLVTSLGSLKEIGYLDGSVSAMPHPNPSFVVKMGYTDAVSDYNGTFANGLSGFSYAGMTGNAVAVSFLPGHLAIDPQLEAESAFSFLDASVQRRLFAYGSIYWSFFVNDNIIDAAYSAPSATAGFGGWSGAGSVPGVNSNFIGGLTVAHFGSQIDLIWPDGSSYPDTRIMMIGGLISQGTGQPYITWGSAQVLVDTTTRIYWGGPSSVCGPGTGTPNCQASLPDPVSAAFAQNGQLDFSYIVNLGAFNVAVPILDRVSCGNVYCSPTSDTFNEVNLAQEVNWAAGPSGFGSASGMLVVPFEDRSGTLAAIWTTSNKNVFAMTQWVNGTMEGAACIDQLDADTTHLRTWSLPSDFDTITQITAAPSGSNVELLLPNSATGQNGAHLEAILLTQSVSGTWGTSGFPRCVPIEDSSPESAYQNSGLNVEPNDLSASTEWDGYSVDLFYVTGSIPEITHFRIFPGHNGVLDAPGSAFLPWSSEAIYQYAAGVAAMDQSSHYVLVTFVLACDGTNICLYTFEVPVPTDYNAGPNDPWVQLPGGPAITEQGSAVNPASGILTYSLPLVSTPVRGGTESLTLVYAEPGIYYGTSSSPSIAHDASPFDSGFTTYGYALQSSMFLDIPWIDTRLGVFHLGATSAFDIQWNTAIAGDLWFNNTRGVRFDLHFNSNAQEYFMNTTSGPTYIFNSSGVLLQEILDSTGGNTLTFVRSSNALTVSSTVGGPTATVNFDTTCANRIDSVVYEGVKTITFTYQGVSGCTQGNSPTLVITDAAGRTTTFTTSYGRLTSVAFSSGGSLAYTYAQNVQWGTGNDVESLYSFPVGKEVVSNQTTPSNIARQYQFGYHFQNLAAIETDVNVTDGAGVVQGSTQYRFEADRSMTSVRVLDSAGQVLYYDMQTLAGSNLADLSGNGNSGVRNSVTTTGGVAGQALTFGSSSFVDATNTASLKPTLGVSVSAWVYLTSISGSYDIVDNSYPGGANNQGGYVLDTSSSGMPIFSVYGATTIGTASGSTAVSTNAWHFIAGTFDGHNVQVYLDGGLQATTPFSAPIAWTGGQSYLDVGCAYYTIAGGFCSAGRHLLGKIDEVRVFGRSLSSDEVASLYHDNVIQASMTQYWWSSNSQPHVTDQYNGYGLATPWSTSMNYVDDWGNIIYTRDPYGSEHFSSFNNTNHQGEFYAPGRLDKTSSGVLYQNNFDYGTNDLTIATQTGDASANMDYGTSGQYLPSMKVAMSAAGSDLKLARSWSSSSSVATVEFHVMSSDSTSSNWFQFSLTGGAIAWSVKFAAGTATFTVGFSQCLASYSANTWYTVAMQEFPGSPANTIYVDMNRVQVCSFGLNTQGNVLTVNGFTFEANNAASSSYAVWLDDVRMINGCGGGYAVVCVNGLQKGQLIEMVGPDGSIESTQEQGGTGTIMLFNGASPAGSFNDVTIGDVTMLVFGVDGTLEYISPRTDFVAGDTYNYVAPRTLMGRLVRTRTGFDYYSSMVINQPTDLNGAASTLCYDASSLVQCGWNSGGTGWTNFGFLPTTSSTEEAHSLGWSQSMMTEFAKGYTSGSGLQTINTNSYLVNYVYLASSLESPAQQPLGFAFGAEYSANSTFLARTWGSGIAPNNQAEPNYANPLYSRFMGPIAVNGQGFTVMKFIVKEGDLFNGATGTMNGYYYQTDGGRGGFFAGTSIGASDTGSIAINNIPSGESVELTWANNTIIPGTIVQSTGSPISIPLYPMISVFPASIKIWVFLYNNNHDVAYYTSAPVTVWGGDQFNYLGQSSTSNSEWYDIGQVGLFNNYIRLPLKVHDSLLGTWAPYGDCTTAVVCYDMETLRSTSGIQNLDGSAWDTTGDVVDLSGHSNDGTLQSGNNFHASTVGNSASGLGLTFDGASTKITLSATGVNTGQWQFTTVSFWMDWTGTSNQMPFGYNLCDLYFASGYFGFNTGNSDILGISSTGLANTMVFVTAIFKNDQTVGNVLYLNGVQQFIVQQLGLPNDGNNYATVNAEVSGWAYNGGYLFGGSIDQFAIYNGALSAQQIMGLYRSQLPNAAGHFFHINALGLPDMTHEAVNGRYVEQVYSYDSYGNLLTSALNGNTTYFGYSGLYSQSFVTTVTEPDGGSAYYAYDDATGKRISSLFGKNCEQTRTSYDTLDRPLQTVMYAQDANTVSSVDMQTSQGNSSWQFYDTGACNRSWSVSGAIGPLSTIPGPTGLAGVAQNFNGNSYLYPSTPFSIPSNAVTMTAWINPADVSAGHPIFEWGTSTAYGVQMWQYGGPSGAVGTYLFANFVDTSGNNHNVVSSSAVFSVGSWYFVAASYNPATGNAYLYVNGQQVGTLLLPTGLSLQTSYTPYIGFRPDGGVYFNGGIDEVRVFNVALSPGAISALMAGTYGALASTTSAYDDTAYPSATSYDPTSVPRSLYLDMTTMKAGQTNTLEDLSGSGNNAVETGVGNGTGEVGGAKTFGGGATRLSLPSSTAANLPSSFTLSAWVDLSTTAETPGAGVIAKGWGGGDEAYALDIVNGNNARVFVRNQAGTTAYTAVSTIALSASTWYLITGVYNASAGSLVIYVNAANAVTTTGVPSTHLTNAHVITIGSREASFTSGYNLGFAGSIDEVQIIPAALSVGQISALYQGYAAGSSTFDPTHMSRVYVDGLGRQVRQVGVDLYGHKLTTAASLGWNDRPLVSYMTTGQFETNLYSFTGTLLRSTSPGSLSTVVQWVNLTSPNVFVYTEDGDGHSVGVVRDLLGRTWGVGDVNPSNNTVNATVVSFDALGLVVTRSDVIKYATIDSTSYYYNAAGLLVYQVNPDSSTQTTTYDGDLRPSTVTDPLGHVAVYTYVSSRVPGLKMGWIANIAYKASAASTTCYASVYTYDFFGDVTGISNGTAQSCGSNTLSATTSTVTRNYDALLRMWKESIAEGSVNLTTNVSFDAASRVTSVTYPQNQGVANYLYDSFGRVDQVNFNNTKYAAVQYDAFGRNAALRFFQAGTNTTEFENFSYDAMSRITAVGVLGGANLMQLVYRYDAASLITSVSDNMYPSGTSHPLTDTYQYDGNGRLISATGPFSANALVGTKPADNRLDYLNYTYDALGNLLKRQDSDLAACSGTCNLWNSAQTINYNYAGPYSELTSTSGARAESFGYNTVGSMTARSNWAFTYDFLQRLANARSTTPAYSYAYFYDGAGRRVEEIDSMATTYTVYYAYAGPDLAYEYNATSRLATVFVYLDGQLLFRKDGGSNTAHFYSADLSSNSRVVWTYVGGHNIVSVEAAYRYKPFGEMATPLTVASTNPVLLYAREPYSSPTKLYLMGARWYAPDLGRFVSRDLIGGHGYAYARNDPLVFRDPTGLYCPGPGAGRGPRGPSGPDPIGAFFSGVWNTITGAINAAPGAMIGFAEWWVGASWNQRGAMFLTAITNMGIGIGAGGLEIGSAICGALGFTGCASDLAAHANAGIRWGENNAYDYFRGWTGAAPDPAGAQVARTWAPFYQFVGPLVLTAAIGGITDLPVAGDVAAIDSGATTAGDIGTTAAEDLTADEAAQVESHVVDALDRAYTKTVETLGPREEFYSPARWGTELHSNFADEIASDPFLQGRAVYSSVGPDVQFEAGNTVWELTTSGQESAHLGRATWSAFVEQGWEVRWLIYS